MESAEVTMLVSRATAGDAAAWDAIVDEYAGLLWSVVRGFRLNEAQAADAVQTTWLRLIEHLADLREPQCMAGWLRTTARRVCLQIVRHGGREQLVDHCEGQARRRDGRQDGVDEDGPESSALRRDQVALVRRVLADLPDRHRRLLELLVADPPLSYRDISVRLGMPIGSIGPVRARILARLREALAAADLRDLVLD